MPTLTQAQKQIADECDALKAMLLDKNRKYGNSALEQAQVGGVVIPAELGILIRIGDKLKRWQTANPGDDEDTVLDLLGYFILLRIARRPLDAIPVPTDSPHAKASIGRKFKGVVLLPGTIEVAELADRMSVKATDVMKKLNGMGVATGSVHDSIDADIAEIVAAEFEYGVTRQ